MTTPQVRPDPAVLAHAVDQALAALDLTVPRPAHERLAAYYDTSGEYAGATFATLAPNVAYDLTAADLLAVTALSVPVGPGAQRRLLDDASEHRGTVLRALQALPAHWHLADVDDDALEDMLVLHRAVKAALSAQRVRDKNAWVTAAKVCARKRPNLLPVRDNEVCGLLGLLPSSGRADAAIDYQVFRHLMRDHQVQDALDAAVARVDVTATVVLDVSRLRLLDAALWTYKVWTGR